MVGLQLSLDDLAAHVRARFGWRSGTRVVLGFSGGPDSAALARILRDLDEVGVELDLHLAFVDHGWQPPLAAERTWRSVASMARELGLPLTREARPDAPLPAKEGPARDHRYKRLLARARAVGAGWIALAHHAGDQAETLLMRRHRGAGAVGSAGMVANRALLGTGVRIARPVLDWPRRRLQAWLADAPSPIDDPANLDPRHDRARLRSALGAWSAPRREALETRMARRARTRQDHLAARTDVLRRALPFSEPETTAASLAWVDARALAPLDDRDFHLALRILGDSLLADRRGPWLTRRHRALMRDLLRTGGSLDLPSSLRFHVRGKRAWLERTDLGPDADVVPTLRRRDAAARLRAKASPYPPAEGNEAMLDARKLGPRAILRPLRDSDRFRPFGRDKNAEPTSVTRWLSKQGVPAFARARTYVVEGHQGIAWVVGHRIDARHALDTDSRVAAALRIVR